LLETIVLTNTKNTILYEQKSTSPYISETVSQNHKFIYEFRELPGRKENEKVKNMSAIALQIFDALSSPSSLEALSYFELVWRESADEPLRREPLKYQSTPSTNNVGP
jgi:hypothetical protein